MAGTVRITAVMPVGPGTREDFLCDSLESIRFWTPNARIILVDDSGAAVTSSPARRYCAEVVTSEYHDRYGGLYLALSLGYKVALESSFDLLLRIDTDGLVANGGFEQHALEYFARHPEVGCIGSFRHGYDGGNRSCRPQRAQVARALGPGAFRRPFVAATLGRYMLEAKLRGPGYRLGDSVLGGACLLPRVAVETLERRGLLGIAGLRHCGLGEDHIFGMLLACAGFRMADMARKGDGLIFGVRHVGIPASPEELIANGKCLVHSVRSWHELSEQEVRQRFAELRHIPRMPVALEAPALAVLAGAPA